jgi:hypothetical protein
MPGNVNSLTQATQRRVRDARRRAQAAIRRLDRDGNPISFVAVAAAAAVSRSLLYRDPGLRAEIQRLRTPDPTRTRIPAAQQATNPSLKRRIEALLDDARALRAENHRLRTQIAALLGEQRVTATRHGQQT